MAKDNQIVKTVRTRNTELVTNRVNQHLANRGNAGLPIKFNRDEATEAVLRSINILTGKHTDDDGNQFSDEQKIAGVNFATEVTANALAGEKEQAEAVQGIADMLGNAGIDINGLL